MFLSQCPDCLSYFVINDKCYGYCEEWDMYVMHRNLEEISRTIAKIRKDLNL